MTFSLLARDEKSGALAGAAATGSLCVGGWVLRGRWNAGLSASQGAAPSTLWGESVLDRMAAGAVAAAALAGTVAPDPNRDWRQLSALDRQGGTAGHSGVQNSALCSHIARPGAVAAGNILSGEEVLHALLDAWDNTGGPPALRLLAALEAAQAAGGDTRGLKSAALLVLQADRPPLTLRIDLSEDPLRDLRALHMASASGSYERWTHAVPVEIDPTRADAALIRADG